MLHIVQRRQKTFFACISWCILLGFVHSWQCSKLQHRHWNLKNYWNILKKTLNMIELQFFGSEEKNTDLSGVPFVPNSFRWIVNQSCGPKTAILDFRPIEIVFILLDNSSKKLQNHYIFTKPLLKYLFPLRPFFGFE